MTTVPQGYTVTIMDVLNSHLAIRLSDETKEKFRLKAQRYGRPSDILRELIEAFIEDRLVIYPPESKDSLYVTRSKN